VARSSPGAVAALVVVQAVEGVAPTVVLAASATLIDRAPAAAESVAARGAVAGALVTVAVALTVAQAAGAGVTTLQSLVSYRFESAVDSMRIEAAVAFPGLAHFDSPELADRLQASRWAVRAGELVNYGGYFVRWASQAVGAAVVAANLGWWAPGLVLATALPTAVNNWRHAGAQGELERAHVGGRRHADYHEGLAVDLGPAREVRLYGLGAWLLGRQERFWRAAMIPVFDDMARQLRQNLLASTAKAVVALVPFVVAFRRLADGSLDVGTFTAGVLALGVLALSLSIIEEDPAELRKAGRFLPELFALADAPRSEPRLALGGTTSPPARPLEGIRFEAVSFTYPGTDQLVLDGLDLWVPAGSSMALVGENGAGKSTLVKLLCRFYDPDEGRITLDGVDLREHDLVELRRRFAVVFQDFTRWPLSVADNVGVGAGDGAAERGLLDEAARRSGAIEVIDRLTEGWETVLAREFGGVDLSGGEWQRVALARALAGRLGRGASLLVLDEPTAALDVRLEADLYRRFAHLTEGLTTLLVSHRFSTVRMADRVAVLESGRVVELGSHPELVRAGGRYAELYALQARRFHEDREGERQP
jgi:ABC-type multidrug transport system fused ATPase/permease subunit